jgi:hypothetical protein
MSTIQRIALFVPWCVLAAVLLWVACVRVTPLPEAAAQAPAARLRWEYKTLHLNEKTTDKTLNQLGADGWDFAGVYAINEMLFKRPAR